MLPRLERPLVKICGVKRLADVELLDGRVDYIGFVTGAGPRQLPPSAIAELASAVSASTPVLVAASMGPGEALEAALEAGVEVIQLHSAMPAEQLLGFVEEAASLGVRAAPVLIRRSPGAWAGSGPETLLEARPSTIEYVLVDADKRSPPGGPRGLRVDPEGVAEAAKLLGGRYVVAAAGGVRPGSACTLIGLGAAMIDTSSGVEEAPGVKDPLLVDALLEELRGCRVRPA